MAQPCYLESLVCQLEKIRPQRVCGSALGLHTPPEIVMLLSDDFTIVYVKSMSLIAYRNDIKAWWFTLLLPVAKMRTL